MTCEEAVSYIHSQKRFGPKPGLDRVRKLLSLVGDPHQKLRFVHIAGTNGKGSTTMMLASVLRQAGYRTGSFISPFVLDFRERFQINGEMIPPEKLAELTERLRPFVEQMNAAGETVAEFELVTALGMLYFYEERCDIVCLEVGIGGLYDSTNVISTPLAAVITAVSFDHTDMLGDTLEEIARQKAGIIKQDTDAVCYALNPPEVVGELMRQCAKTASRLHLPSPAAVKEIRTGLDGTGFVYEEQPYHIPLAGEHQAYNALSVLQTVEILCRKGFSISQQAVEQGLAAAAFPARFELVHEHPLIVIDGAHNPGGAEALARTLRQFPAQPKAAVIGALKEKEYQCLLKEICPMCKRVVAVDIHSLRALPKEELCRAASAYCGDCVTEAELSAALRRAAEAVGEDGMVIVCGSLYLASEIRETAKRYPQ